MLSSPRSPSSTMRILSSAEKCRRVARRMVFSTCVAGSFTGPDFCLIFAPRKATMSQKSSLPQPAESISRVLTADSLDAHTATAMAMTGKDRPEDITPEERQMAKPCNFGLLYRMGDRGFYNYLRAGFQ